MRALIGTATAAALVACGLAVGAMPSTAAPLPLGPGIVDQVIFGNGDSENAHDLKAPESKVVEGAEGIAARVSLPTDPQSYFGGDITFTAAIDPSAQNYFTVKLWGSDSQDSEMQLYVDGERVGMPKNNDYNPLVLGGEVYNKRFSYATTAIPLELTKGRTSVSLTLKTFAAVFNYGAGNFNNFYPNKFKDESRGYYSGYVHTSAKLPDSVVDTEQQAPALVPTVVAGNDLDVSSAQAQKFVDTQVSKQNAYIQKLLDATTVTASSGQDILNLTEALRSDWGTNGYTIETDATVRAAALEKIRSMIDGLVVSYLNKPSSMMVSYSNSVWGGSFNAAGQALWELQQMFANQQSNGQDGNFGPINAAGWEDKSFTDWLQGDQMIDWASQPGAALPTEGRNFYTMGDWNGEKLSSTTRFQAYQEIFFLGYTYARSHERTITNQVLDSQYGAFAQNLGLIAINSNLAENYSSSLRQLYSSSGVTPWLGSDILPEGSAVELHGSDIAVSGLAAVPAQFDADHEYIGDYSHHFGDNYYIVTPDGLTREMGYVAGYGEASNMLLEAFQLTYDDEILKKALDTVNARNYLRYPDVDDAGNRVMRLEESLDTRTPHMPGRVGYQTLQEYPASLMVAGTHRIVSQLEEKDANRYSADEWKKYLGYLDSGLGAVQQQLVDNNFLTDYLKNNRNPDPWVVANYKYAAGAQLQSPLPMTNLDFYSDTEKQAWAAAGVDLDALQSSAFVDITDSMVAVRTGNSLVSLNFFPSGSTTGIGGTARVHAQTPSYSTTGSIAAQYVYEPSGSYNTRPNWTNDPNIYDTKTQSSDGAWQATAGEIKPVAATPWLDESDYQIYSHTTTSPLGGRAELYRAVYGRYLIVLNATGNEFTAKSYDVAIPSGFTGSTIKDLVSGQELPVADGHVTVVASQGVVLDLGNDQVVDDIPASPLWADASASAGSALVSWTSAANATGSYLIQRAPKGTDAFAKIGEANADATSFFDTTVEAGQSYDYRVAGTTSKGRTGLPSPTASIAVPEAIAVSPWSSSNIDGVETGLTVDATDDGKNVTIAGVGTPTEPNLTETADRWDANAPDAGSYSVIPDYAVAYQNAAVVKEGVSSTNITFSAKVTSTNKRGETGLTLRDGLATNARGLYFTVDPDGNYYISWRQWPDQSPMYDMRGDGYNVYDNINPVPVYGSMPVRSSDGSYYLQLQRSGNNVLASSSADGTTWNQVASLYLPLTESSYVGVVSSRAASFSDIELSESAGPTLHLPVAPDVRVSREASTATLTWEQARWARSYAVYRTTDADGWKTEPKLSSDGVTPENGSLWELVAQTDQATRKYVDDGREVGTAYYTVVGTYSDGTIGTFSPRVAGDSDAIDVVLAKAEALKATDFTKASWGPFAAELARIVLALEQPDPDTATLTQDLYAAMRGLVGFSPVAPVDVLKDAKITTSHAGFGATGTPVNEVGKNIFDRDTSTTITLATAGNAVGDTWVTADFGDRPVVLASVSGYPQTARADTIDRMNGGTVQGSNDGNTWADLATFTGVAAAQWYPLDVSDQTAYRYVRYAGAAGSYSSITELELNTRRVDTSVADAVLNGLREWDYTPDSWAALAAPKTALDTAVRNLDQGAVDSAAEQVVQAVGSLVMIDLPALLERAHGEVADGYTRASYFVYIEALNLIASEATKPDMDEAKLRQGVYDAHGELVVRPNDLDTIDTGALATITTSHAAFNGAPPINEAGKLIFDGNTGTTLSLAIPGTKIGDTWVQADFGTKPVVIAAVRAYPQAARADTIARMDGGVVQASNDGTTWVDLGTFTGVNAAQWYSVAVADTTAYRYVRYAGPASSYSSISEFELSTLTTDNSLIELLSDRASKLKELDYDAAGWEAMQAALQAAASLANANQSDVDAAASALAAALGALTPETGPATGVPGIGTLSTTNGWSGLKDGNFEVHMDLWWGQNATQVQLYENGTLITTKRLSDATPKAQSVVVPITGRADGTYVYTAVLSNKHGSTATTTATAVVTAALPGKGVLSHDGRKGNGSYTVTFNLWWGTNGDTYRLYENDELIDSQQLDAATPKAQKTTTALSGKAAGVYTYRAELQNPNGTTSTESITVTVK